MAGAKAAVPAARATCLNQQAVPEASGSTSGGRQVVFLGREGVERRRSRSGRRGSGSALRLPSAAAAPRCEEACHERRRGDRGSCRG